MDTVENLPEEMELDENEWYEYHYQVKRNLFILRQIMDFAQEAQMIYVEEPRETYITGILRAFGHEVHRSISPDRMTVAFGIEGDEAEMRKKFDVLLLLNVIELHDEHPEAFLKKRLLLLKDGGRIFLTTENIAQFSNRMKLLLGRSIFLRKDNRELYSYRKFGISDLMNVCANAGLRILKWELISPFPPFRMEALTLPRYLLKYFNYYVMKALPAFRDTLFVAITPDLRLREDRSVK